MKKTLILFALIPLILFSSPAVSSESSLSDDIQSSLQKIVDSLAGFYRSERSIEQGGFFIRVMTPGKSYLTSSGMGVNVTDDLHFRIASVTKTFTAAAIMLLHQQGKINIYDYITENIPGKDIPYIPLTADYDIPSKDRITIELLLQHRAGVFDVTNQMIPDSIDQPYAGKFYIDYVIDSLGEPLHQFTFDEMVGVAAKNHLSNYLPDTSQYHYSNTGYNLLGKIIERVSGLSYSEYLKENFFDPLMLTNTSSVWKNDDINIPPPFIPSFLYESGKMKNTTTDNMSPNVSEGNIISTPENISRWIKLLLTGNAGINKENVELMKNYLPTGRGNGGYGLGISYMEGLGYGHNGAHESYLTIAAYNSEKDLTILVGSNFWNYPDIYEQLGSMLDSGLRAVKMF